MRKLRKYRFWVVLLFCIIALILSGILINAYTHKLALSPLSIMEDEENMYESSNWKDALPTVTMDGGQKPECDEEQDKDTIWVDGENGNNENSGLTPKEALNSVQAALDKAYPGVTIRIQPGVYRESITPKSSGEAGLPITLVANKGPGTVIIRGSELSSSLDWTQLTENSIGLPLSVNPFNIYVTDLSSWNLKEAPRFIVAVDAQGKVVSRLLLAREPDFRVDTEWKFTEFWWSANGGSSLAKCDPTQNDNKDCDLSNRSYTVLTDSKDDADPQGIEAGNLTKFGNLSGATLVAMDAHHSNYVYRRTIISNDPSTGSVTVDDKCDNDGEPALGWGSKYYIENHPSLLDQPGEWWFDTKSGNLYLWSPTGKNPKNLNLEISRLDTAFDLSNTSFITLDGLNIELYNGNAYQIVNKKKTSAALGNQITNSQIRYADRGIVLYHFVHGLDDKLAIAGFTLENSEIAFMDSTAFDSSFGWFEEPSPELFSYAGVCDLVISGNEFHHLGFYSNDRSAVGIRIFYPDHLLFERNHIYDVAQNGVHLHLSLIDSDKTYNLSPDEIKLGEILIKDNIFEKACQAASDCGGLKIGGNDRPSTHVFRDVLITGNIFRHNFGWSYVSIQRRLNTVGDGNGFYLDRASGVHVYRNVAFNNSGAGYKLTCLWRDGQAIFYNNISANNYTYGFKLTGEQSCDDHAGSVDTQLVNNIIINNGMYGFQFVSAKDNEYGNLVIDYNLYFQNGWDSSVGGSSADIQLYRGLLPPLQLSGITDIQNYTSWEAHGINGDPLLLDYDVNDHRKFEYTEITFQPSFQSYLLTETGSEELPASLVALMINFGVDDIRCGSSYEIGPSEIYKALPDFFTQGTQSEWPDGLLSVNRVQNPCL